MKKIANLTLLLSLLTVTYPSFGLTLKIADNHSKEDSTVQALESFSKNIAKETNGKIKAKVYANGILGDETQVLQQIQQGIIDIGRISTSNLSQFNQKFSIISMPYLFNDMDHFKKFASSEIGQNFLKSTSENGFIGVTFYTNGFRSFYTTNTPINSPADLNGLKIRVIGDPTSIEMVNKLGGKATPMAYSEVFSALQQGVLDGAESAVTVLTNGSHGEVAKFFSFDEHSLIPDVVVISKKTFEKLNTQEKEILINEIKNSWKLQDKLFMEDMEKAYKTAKEKMGVKFNTVDKQPFREKVQSMYNNLPKDQKDTVDKIRAL